MDFISGIIQNSIAGFVDAATVNIGGQAGDLLIRAGDAIENVGRGYGNSVSGKFDNWGTAIKSHGGTPRPALPSTKPVKAAGDMSRPKTIARSNSSPAVPKAKAPASVSKAALSSRSNIPATPASKPTPLRPAASKIQSRPDQKRAASQPSQQRPDNIKYTPGVLTGMPKEKPSAVKRASPSTKPSAQDSKPKGGEVKYTPGKLTGMPTKPGVKSSRPTKATTTQSKPPMKRADSKSKTSKNGPGERIDRTFF